MNSLAQGRVITPSLLIQNFGRHHQVAIPTPTYRIITRGKTLVRAIEALGTIDSSGPFERMLARVLITAYEPYLRAIVKGVPAWIAEEILSTSKHSGNQ
jgi:hypothetical protein